MKCRSVQRILIDGSGRGPEAPVRARLEEHLAGCPDCAVLDRDLSRLRDAAEGIKTMDLPLELDQKTERFCLRRIADLRASGRIRSERREREAIPAAIWAALFLLGMTAGALIIPVLRALFRAESIQGISLFSLGMLAQNLAMLVLSPVLLRRLRGKSFSPMGNGNSLNEKTI